jgi:drug/metabolite transporter (DMT)-like permease
MNVDVAIFLSLAAALSWGVAQVVSKLGLTRLEVSLYAAIRASFAFLFTVLFGFATGAFVFSDPLLIGMASVSGLIDSFLGTLLYMYALKRGQAHGAAALANTAPFWGVVTAVVFLGEPARYVTFLAALLVAAGAYFLIAPTGRQGHSGSIIGGLAALGAALFWGVAEVGPAKYCLSRGMSPAEFQLVLVGTASLIWWAAALWRRPSGGWRLDPVGVWIAFFTAGLGFFLGWILWLSGLQLAEASLLTPIRGGAMTIFAFATSVVLLGERPKARSFLGAALAIAGVVLVSLGS